MKKVRHLGLIPDGGRRWARENGVPLLASYLTTTRKVQEYVVELYARGLQAVSVFMLSRWNLVRQGSELEAIFEAATRFLQESVPVIANHAGVEVRIAGELGHLPQQFEAEVLSAISACPRGGPRKLYLCLAYDPLDELLHAVGKSGHLVSKRDLLNSLWVDEELDLVIRTGGARTLGQFLPLQCGYARIIFLDELFNDTTFDLVWKQVLDHENIDLKYGL